MHKYIIYRAKNKSKPFEDKSLDKNNKGMWPLFYFLYFLIWTNETMKLKHTNICACFTTFPKHPRFNFFSKSIQPKTYKESKYHLSWKSKLHSITLLSATKLTIRLKHKAFNIFQSTNTNRWKI